MATYIGLTIGPIVKTLQNAKSTGELWGSSYIFSYMMKELIKELRVSRTFVTPYVEDDSIFNDKNGIGLFHDRFIFRSEPGDFEMLEEKINAMLRSISYEIASSIKKEKEDVYDYIKQYFKLYYLEMDLDEDKNKILEISKKLDILELHNPPVINDRLKYLSEFLKNDIKNSFLAHDAYGKNKDSFLSIPEIGAAQFGKKLSIAKDEESYNEALKCMLITEGNIKEYKKPHRYVSLVQADGDNITSIINALKSDEDYKGFSKRLLNFSRNAHEIIEEDYHGMTIFAGGDDLLFLAPVLYQGTTVFELLDKLSNEFEKSFGDMKLQDNSQKPTLSFGMSIAYNKFPLYEALEASFVLLREAKNYKGSEGREKNAIAYRVLKHSGQYFGSVIDKASDSYDLFKKMISKYNDEVFLKSVQNKISQDKKILMEIIEDKKRLSNYFANNFNEEVHKKRGNEDYFAEVVDLVHIVYDEMKHMKEDNEDKKGKEKALDSVFSYLKTIGFLNEKGE